MTLDLTAIADGYTRVPPVMLRVTAERLLEQLDLVDRHVWIDREFDRDWLRSQTSVAMSLALAMLDTIPPVR